MRKQDRNLQNLNFERLTRVTQAAKCNLKKTKSCPSLRSSAGKESKLTSPSYKTSRVIKNKIWCRGAGCFRLNCDVLRYRGTTDRMSILLSALLVLWTCSSVLTRVARSMVSANLH